MAEYVKRFKSGKISHYLRVSTRLITGKYGIDTMSLKKEGYTVNLNYPTFAEKEDAESFLKENFEIT